MFTWDLIAMTWLCGHHGPENDMPVRVFISYAHTDEIHRKELEKFLKPLKRSGLVEVWHDREIGAGQEWAGQISTQLEQAQLVLMLVSQDFINSDYCMDKEVHLALERHARREAVVVPIILRPCTWKDEQFARLQALPRDGRPVTTWGNPDEAWSDVASGLRAAIQRISP